MNVAYDAAESVVEAAKKAERPVVVYSVGLTEEGIEALKPLGEKARFLRLEPGPNVRGAEAAGLKARELEEADLLYVLLGEKPAPEWLLQGLDHPYLVVQAGYHSPLVERADVVLPAPLWFERHGYVTNLDGDTLALNPALDMPEGVREESEVLKTLAEKL
jgi:NADH dehydrogenase/NADH:ubiquinone oxidoreductase subunit G